VVSGPRSAQPLGLELAELRLLEALRAQPNGVTLEIPVVGRRSARRHARRVGGRWIPTWRRTVPRRAVHRADLVHLIGLDLSPPRRKTFVAMVHDLSPLHYDDEGELPPWIDEIIARAAFLLTPSAFTAAELHRHLGVPRERVRIIGSGPALAARDAEPLSRSELRRYGIEPPFILRYGGYTKRKNVPLLLEAWARVPFGTLVLAGPSQHMRKQILADAPSLDRVVVLDYVPETLLARFLRSAAGLGSTSSYEGFGLPPLEAMAAGTPVVAVSTPFVREVCGDAALLVEASAPPLGEALCRLLDDGQLAQRLRAAGRRRARTFTWSAVASAVLRAYSSASQPTKRVEGKGIDVLPQTTQTPAKRSR
jgi:glycosyltransferase involved in cell wall biosynthesis